MFFITLSIGLILVVTLHLLLTFFSKAQPQTVRRILHVVFVGVILIGIGLFMRFGLPHMAAILGFAAVFVPLVQRFRQSAHAQNMFSGTAAGRKNRMSIQLAQEVLGIDDKADEKAIREAHRRLIYKNHPDAGGSAYLASQINEARDVLLAHRQEKG